MTDYTFRFSLLGAILFLLLTGCGGKEIPAYKGEQYPVSNRVIPVFQTSQVPVSCRVFAQLHAWFPENSTAQTIAQALEQEAKQHGADILLIGESRVAKEEMDVTFSYYDTEKELDCREQWPGWTYGFDSWACQGEWITFGYNEWGNEQVTYSTPIVLQAAFLKCKQ